MTTIIPIPLRPDALPPPKPLDGERARRREPAIDRRPTSPTTTPGSWPASATTWGRSACSSRTWASSRPTATSTGRACCWDGARGRTATPQLTALAAALASGTTVTDYDHLLPLHRRRARQHQRRGSAHRAEAARVVGKLRRRRRDLRGEEPDRVRAGAGRRGRCRRRWAASNGARCSTSRATCSSSSTCSRCRAAARSAAPPAWSTAARRPTSSWRRTLGQRRLAQLRGYRHQAGAAAARRDRDVREREDLTRSGPAAARSRVFRSRCST